MTSPTAVVGRRCGGLDQGQGRALDRGHRLAVRVRLRRLSVAMAVLVTEPTSRSACVIV